jgi:hypothetical protein
MVKDERLRKSWLAVSLASETLALLISSPIVHVREAEIP